jgi:ApaG protein
VPQWLFLHALSSILAPDWACVVNESTNNPIEITVEVIYSPGHSVANRLFYIYFITITNTGKDRVQLLRRHFLIRDGQGFQQEVDGEGVVGEQPFLEPNQTYRYHSGVPIARPPGAMSGHYTFQNANGELFDVPLPAFVLYEPAGYIPPNDALLNDANLEALLPSKNRVIN